MHLGKSRTSPVAWSLRASLLLLLLLVAADQGDAAAYLSTKDTPGDELLDSRAADLGDFAGLAALLRDYLAGRLQELPSSSRARFADSAASQISVAKRGVMMGVDLPDFILNRNQPSKNLQALRQRLFESGRRR